MQVERADNATYHTDVVTVRMLARMPELIDDICDRLTDDTEFMAEIGTGVVPGDAMIENVRFVAWTYRRLIARIAMVGGHVFADAVHKWAGDLPEMLRIAAAGRPCGDTLGHPAFDGILWNVDQDGDANTLKADLHSDIDLGSNPGTRLRLLALAERGRLLKASRPPKRYDSTTHPIGAGH
jgi:hypothetical protein